MDTGLKTLVDLYEEPCLPLADLKPEPGLQNFIETEPNCDLYATRSCLHQFCNCTLYSLSFPKGKLQSSFPVVGCTLLPSQKTWLGSSTLTNTTAKPY